MWDITIHPPSGPSVLTGTPPHVYPLRGTARRLAICSPPQSMWDITIYPPSGPSVLTGTSPHVYPIWGTARRLAHRPVSGSNAICNDPHPQLTNSLWALFWASPQGFRTRLLGEGFHTLINYGCSPPPTNVGHHKTTFLC